MKKGKKGVSLMVSYVLIVVIAIALSILVYAFLKLYLPSTRAECPADISLIVDSFSCNLEGQIITVNLTNRGLFNVSGVYLRFGAVGRVVRPQINEGDEQELKGTGDRSPLAPGESTSEKTYAIPDLLKAGVEDYILEVQPAIFAERALVPCEDAIITQPVKCLNITLHEEGSYLLEQEDANQTACEGDWNVTHPCSNTTDGDWDTYGRAQEGSRAFLYVNYSKPDGDVQDSSYWVIKDGEGVRNITFSRGPASGCWRNPLQFMVNSTATIDRGTYWNCWDGTGFVEVSVDPNHARVEIYEEAMWWNIT